MKKETRMMDVYVAEDGKEFANEADCSKYEDGVLRDKKNIRYFRVFCDPDLTETGCMMTEIPVAVLSEYGCHSGIVANWCVRYKKLPIIGQGVQGWGFQEHFRIMQMSEADYFSSENGKKVSTGCWQSARVFLSPRPVDGYPLNYDYITEWKFK